MAKEFRTIQNISKRDFLIKIEVKGKKENFKLRQGSTRSLLKENAEKLLELYPLELKDLTQAVKIVESDRTKELGVEIENKDKEIKKLEGEVISLKEQIKSEKEKGRTQEVEINKLKVKIEKLEDLKNVKKINKILENKDNEIKFLKKKLEKKSK